MKHCCSDGDLRAYLDGEAEDPRLSIAAHLEVCPECGERYRELSERAAWVSAVIALTECAPIPARQSRPRRWPVAAVALAAAVAIAFLLLPQHGPVRPAPDVAKIVAPPAPAEEFVRLDDEPIETATLVRASTDDGLQADLIVGPDGRAHAIRIVRNR